MKKTLQIDLNFGWKQFIFRATKSEVLDRFSQLPENVEFGYAPEDDYNYDKSYCYFIREETDEEFSERLALDSELKIAAEISDKSVKETRIIALRKQRDEVVKLLAELENK